MEIIILIIVGLLLFLGILGAVLPILPGPFLSYSGLLVYHLYIHKLPADFILFIGIAVFFISALDYFLQIYGVKYAGGGKYAIRGSLVGLLLGIIFADDYIAPGIANSRFLYIPASKYICNI